MPKASVVSVLAVAAMVGLAFLSNPSAEKHRAKIREQVAERSPLAGLLGVGQLTAFASTYHPLGMASYTTASGKVVSVGAFGVVVVMLPWEEKR
ncbi:hypothetical protein [Rhizobacter sp. Root1221]|uniref:hypothetical protein n=1 Tax=Rhizobacter sp. Root1221 TaxID=1736433 RepID=UPI0006F8B70A|nr:hypothetical protein [Rhizobacter sp. Root1221]KQW00242.1 hypothetical protein ASC87_18360 [Rhizobacter sp. Root1221]